MRETPNALKILFEEREKKWLSVPEELVRNVYQIEERVQFDATRNDVPQKIRQALKTILDKESLKGPLNGDAI